LETGTWFGHLAEHVAIELQSLAGGRVSRGKTRLVPGRSGTYDILFVYIDERAALLAGMHALRLLSKLLPRDLAELRGLNILPKSNLPADARADGV
jgi:cyanophycin synthetase